MPTAYLLIGGNMGDREKYMEQAKEGLEELGNIQRSSRIYETAAWGVEDQPSFLNQAICLNTNFSPHNLLEETQRLERRLDRVREKVWHERTMDIDIIYYDDDVIDTKLLQVPHPRMQDRNFVLVPLAEIAPNLPHPILGKTTETLLHQCPDELQTKVWTR